MAVATDISQALSKIQPAAAVIQKSAEEQKSKIQTLVNDMSKAIDENSAIRGTGNDFAPMDPHCRACNRGPAGFNVPLANGGAWPYHNMHLQAGVSNGGLVEMHYLAVEFCRRIYRDLPEPKDGWLTLPDAPGLGFEPDRDAIRDIAKSSQASAG